MLLLSAGALGFLAWKELHGAPSPVTPADLAAVDPEIRPVLEQHLAIAERNPESAESHGTLGLIYEANEMWGEAERSYRIAAELSPSESLWRIHRAIALRELGDFETALALLERSAAENERSAVAQFHLGDALLAAGRTDEAVDRFQEVVRLAPDQPEGLVALGRALLSHQRPAEAAVHLEKAVARDPQYMSARYALGLAYRGLSRNDEAERELALGLGGQKRRFPDALSQRILGFSVDLASQIDRAGRLLRSGKMDESIKLLEGLAARRPEDMAVINNLAVAYKQRGEIERALDLLERAKTRSPDEFSTWINLASCLLDQGRLGEAEAHVQRALELAPEIGAAHHLKAQILARQRRFSEAYLVLKTSLSLDARNAEAHVLLGEVCLALELHQEARATLETALRIAPDHVRAHLDLAGVWLELSRLDDAERELEIARKLAPGDPLVARLAELIAKRRSMR